MGLLLISALTHECRLSTGNAAESTGWSGGSHRRRDAPALLPSTGAWTSERPLSSFVPFTVATQCGPSPLQVGFRWDNKFVP
jgi:hypothetical protein